MPAGKPDVHQVGPRQPSPLPHHPAAGVHHNASRHQSLVRRMACRRASSRSFCQSPEAKLLIQFAAAPIEDVMQLREWLSAQWWQWPHRDRSPHSRYISRATVACSRMRLRCCG
jgi:hypothetical protein